MSRIIDAESVSTPVDSQGDALPLRKRRRVLACQTCRRIKSRCDFTPGTGSCVRCKTLRINCSLAGEDSAICTISETSLNTDVLIRDLYNKLSEQQNLLVDIKNAIEHGHTSSVRQNLPPVGGATIISPGTEESEDGTQSPADNNTETAPVVMIRNILRRAHGGSERLSNHGIQALVALGLFSHSMVINLTNIFMQRLGPWLQMSKWEDIGVDPNLESVSSLLISACAFQGIRFSQFRHSQLHSMLYEHIRKELAPVLIISPLPMDCLHGLLIMTLWNMAPLSQGRPEFIDSWLISGQAVQQGMLAIQFTTIIANVKGGKATANDKLSLRVWNTICLEHLCFSVGTGRPSIIAEQYLDQCSSILNISEASVYDGIVVAEIFLYSIVLKLLTTPRPMPSNGSPKELIVWEEKWGHLLDGTSNRALLLRISYHFGNLVLSQRSYKNLTSSTTNKTTTSPAVEKLSPSYDPSSFEDERASFVSFSIDHATKLLNILIGLPENVTEEMPDSLVLSCIWAIISLTSHYDEAANKEATMRIIRESNAYCKNARMTPIAPTDYAIAQLDRKIHQEGMVEVSIPASNDAELGDLGAFGNAGFHDMDFPSVEDLFGGTFMTGIADEELTFDLGSQGLI